MKLGAESKLISLKPYLYLHYKKYIHETEEFLMTLNKLFLTFLTNNIDPSISK